ncbi:uncharacterized protein EV420DRAFT_1645206 [Desarmillaria tabescens]|nr:uncharacterized protein EV420DRAFT_1645206 [Desarmillaria tabescens]KAK0453985.1 hypothetical protein EV420DRAFT_1645206 [Desarmillaria tabescens]
MSSNHTFLDPSLYTLAEDEAAFIKSQTGIYDGRRAKKPHIRYPGRGMHSGWVFILAFRASVTAMQIYPFSSIHQFEFAQPKISKLPCYQQFLNLGRGCKGIYADIGCCLGADPRKAVMDGYPIDQIVASDLRPEFWELGHKFFKSTPETFPARFIPVDIFDLTGLSKTEGGPIPDISKVQSLAELRGNISAIHASALFHFFNYEEQFELGKIMASLLSFAPGFMIFGAHVSRPEGQIYLEVALDNDDRYGIFFHSPES